MAHGTEAAAGTANVCTRCDDQLLVPDGQGERELCTCAARCRKCREPQKRDLLDDGYCPECVARAFALLPLVAGVGAPS